MIKLCILLFFCISHTYGVYYFKNGLVSSSAFARFGHAGAVSNAKHQNAYSKALGLTASAISTSHSGHVLSHASGVYSAGAHAHTKRGHARSHAQSSHGPAVAHSSSGGGGHVVATARRYRRSLELMSMMLGR